MKPCTLCKSKLVHVHVLSKTCLHQALFCNNFSVHSQLRSNRQRLTVPASETLPQGGRGGWVCEGLQKVDSTLYLICT